MDQVQKWAFDELIQGKSNLFLPYGVGKTLIAIAIWQLLNPATNTGMAAMVFCPSHNVLSWTNEIEKWCGNEFPIVTHKALKKPLPKRAVVLLGWPRIINRSNILADLIAKEKPAVIIADESTRIKTPHAKVTKTALALATAHDYYVPSGVRFALSGLPQPEGPHELWSQFAFSDRDAFNSTTYGKFLNTWFIKTNYGWALRLDRTNEFYGIAAKTSVTEKGLPDHLSLDKHDERYVLEIYKPHAKQKQLMRKLYRDWEIGNEELTTAMAVAMKAQQIASGFYYDEDKQPVFFLRELKQGIPKTELMLEVMRQLFTENPFRKIIVWSNFRAERKPLKDAIEVTLDKKVVIGPNDEALTAFASLDKTSPRVIIMPATVSQGFNELVNADVCIFYSNTYSGESRQQAEKRIARRGQTSQFVVHIDLVGKGMLDANIVTMVQSKSLTTARLNVAVSQYTQP